MVPKYRLTAIKPNGQDRVTLLIQEVKEIPGEGEQYDDSFAREVLIAEYNSWTDTQLKAEVNKMVSDRLATLARVKATIQVKEASIKNLQIRTVDVTV